MTIVNLRSALGALAMIVSLAGLLGASDDDNSAMYLRVPTMHDAPPVLSVSYSATAAIPRRPMKPSLVPPERVTGTILLATGTMLPAPTLQDFHGVTSFTVVRTSAQGTVTQRTRFTGVAVQSIALTTTSNGGSARRISFLAATVTVTLSH